LSIVALGAAMMTPGFADTATKQKLSSAKHASTTTWPQTCPVSGAKIASAKDAVGSAVYKGKTYYFCCPMCKPLFVKDPAKYVTAASKGKYLAPM
jgi:YHS domain-containing protein